VPPSTGVPPFTPRSRKVLDYHPATITRWSKRAAHHKRVISTGQLVVDEHWSNRVDKPLAADPRLLSTSVFAIIAAEDFEGSYPTVSRHVRSVRGPRFRRVDKASGPIETAPDEECQFDCRTAVTSESCSASESCTASGQSAPGHAGAGRGSPPRSASTTPWKDSHSSTRLPAVHRSSRAPTGWGRSAPHAAGVLSGTHRCSTSPGCTGPPLSPAGQAMRSGRGKSSNPSVI